MNQLPSIPTLASQIAARQLTCETLVNDVLARIGRVNPAINAFITVTADRARAEARALDAEVARGRYRGPLHGIPISVKDLVDVEGVPTTAGSRVRQHHLAARDAPVVARLRAAGAIVVGKTNLHEFAYGTTSEDSAYGAVRNPLDVEHSAGGSSGGSAAALAAGLCAGSVGTDTGGSIRIPSAACGVVGLKPGYGEISADGVVALSQSLDHVGPMATDVAGIEALFAAMRDRPRPREEGSAGGGAASLASARVGVPRPYFLDLLDRNVRAHFEKAVDRMRRAGATLSDVAMAHASAISTVYLHIQLPESSCYHARSLERQPRLYSPAVRERLEMGRYVLAEDYVRAQRGREVLRKEVDDSLDHADVLALPTLAIPAPRLGQPTARLGDAELPVRAIMLRLTQLFDVTGHPAVSLPMGKTPQGLPTALQLVGRQGKTDRLLSVARAVETLLAGS